MFMTFTHILLYMYICVGDGGANGRVSPPIAKKVKGVHKVESKSGDVKAANEDGRPSDLANNKS